MSWQSNGSQSQLSSSLYSAASSSHGPHPWNPPMVLSVPWNRQYTVLGGMEFFVVLVHLHGWRLMTALQWRFKGEWWLFSSLHQGFVSKYSYLGRSSFFSQWGGAWLFLKWGTRGMEELYPVTGGGLWRRGNLFSMPLFPTTPSSPPKPKENI